VNLTVESLTFGYLRSRPVIRDYTKVFQRGITLFKGYSGCGKSTLLKLLAGPAYLKPQLGTVALDGRPVTEGTARRDIGFVFQQLNLLPLASVERNIAMAGLLAGLSTREVQTRIQAILAAVGLSGLEKRAPETLSGGQQQRAAIARALVKHPKVLLLDEPTSGLDDGNTGLIMEILSGISRDTVCVISTHDARLLPLASEIIAFPLETPSP
jgi:ABC-type lipoprotein export system ATPase subunit